MISHGKDIKVFTGNSNPALAQECDRILTLENGLPASQEGGPWED